MSDDRETVLQRLMTNIDDSYDKTEGSFMYDTQKPAAIEFESAYTELEDAKAKIDVENLTGDELANFVYQRTGIKKKEATYASASVTINGQEGASIDVDEVVSTDTINFLATELKTVDATGQMTVIVKCELTGSIGNVPAGAIKYFPVTLAGLDTVTNLEAVTDGYDAETDEELRQRYYEKIQTPSTSGNRYQYRNWAKEVTGVGDAKVYPLWNGDNTVKVVVIDSNKQPANAELVATVQEYIDPGITGTGDGEAPIGAFCTVASATAKVIDIAFTAIKDAAVSDADRLLNVTNSEVSYFKEIAFKDEVTEVSIARIGALVLGSNGILDYTNLTLNGGTANIPLADGEVPVLGQVTIN